MPTFSWSTWSPLRQRVMVRRTLDGWWKSVGRGRQALGQTEPSLPRLGWARSNREAQITIALACNLEDFLAPRIETSSTGTEKFPVSGRRVEKQSYWYFLFLELPYQLQKRVWKPLETWSPLHLYCPLQLQSQSKLKPQPSFKVKGQIRKIHHFQFRSERACSCPCSQLGWKLGKHLPRLQF